MIIGQLYVYGSSEPKTFWDLYLKVEKIKKGDLFLYLGKSNNLYKILVKNKIRFVSKRILCFEATEKVLKKFKSKV